MFDWLSGIKERLETLGSSVADSLKQPFQNLGITILEGIKAIFVPSEDFITDKVNSILSRFSFAKSVADTIEIFKTFFTETLFTEPPKVHINLGYAESKYDYGGQTYCLDMSWYARYKPTVDSFLSGFMWVVFIWRIFTSLPNILNGVGSAYQPYNVMNDSKDYVKWSLRGGKK